MIGSAIAAGIASAIDAQKAFDKYLSTLTEEERKECLKKIEEQKQHERALEIANASRPRNFWGQ